MNMLVISSERVLKESGKSVFSTADENAIAANPHLSYVSHLSPINYWLVEFIVSMTVRRR